jgi:predicted Rdx family selenoprotein
VKDLYPDATIELIPSRGGRFEVSVDGTPVFEKSKLGRHAKPGEIARLIEKTRQKSAASRGLQ